MRLMRQLNRLKILGLRILAFIVSHIIYLLNCFRWHKPAVPGKIIWVKPSSITRSIEFTHIVKQRKYYLNGIIKGGDWGKQEYSVFKIHDVLFESFKKRFKHKIPFTETEYFKSKTGSTRVIDKQLEEYNKKYSSIYNQIKEEGFKIPSSVFDQMDTFKVSIASNGDFLFMTGKHRLAIARLMGQDFRIPVKVSHRHKEWQEYRDQLYLEYCDGKISKEQIQKLEHPDLLDLIE